MALRNSIIGVIVIFNIGMSQQKAKIAVEKSKKIKKNEEKAESQAKGGNNGKNASIKGDARFAKAQYDPKFMAPSAKVTKVKIDKRFSKMMSDPAFKSQSSVDRYGRKVAQNEANKQLEQYYYMENEKPEDVEEIEPEEDVEAEEQEENQEGEGGLREWMENYNQESSELEDIDVQMLEPDNDVWSDESEHVIKNDKVQATRRLALCNYDWMNISAKDLMILFNSFKTNTGYIKSIKVYMSNIGKEKLEQEEKYGPQGIWKQKAEEEPEEKKNWKKSWKELMEERQKETDNNAFDEDKLRQYQKDRLKYFYAVIECDSKKTADEIYKECDGNQFENSNLLFDLRFIPDDLSFDSNTLKEECNELPVGGQVKNFVSRAMGHSKVTLSWEDPELSLPASLKKKNWNRMSEAELDKVDWGLYLNEDDIDEDDNLKKLYNTNQEEKEDKSAISDWRKAANKKNRQDDDIEITFEGGFDGGKKNKKNERYDNQKEEVPSLKQQKKSMKERWRNNEEEKKKRREQLELLVDNNTNQEFKVDLQDDRFKAVYNNPSFSIDPVDPRFDHRKTGKVFAEVVKRNKGKNRE